MKPRPEHLATWLQRLGNRNVAVWRGICQCGDHTPVRPLISIVLADLDEHGDLHKMIEWQAAA